MIRPVQELMQQRDLDDVFAHRYGIDDAAWLDGEPAGESAMVFGHAEVFTTEDFSDGGMLLRVTPSDGPAWLALFEGGDWAYGYSAFCTTPDPDWFCAVCDGEAWLVNASDPSRRHYTEITGVRSIVPIPDREILLLACLWYVDAYGRDGLRLWRSETLVGDDLRIVSVDERGVHVIGADADDPESLVRLVLDPSNGMVVERETVGD